MHSQMVLRVRTKFTVQLLCVCICCSGAAAQAAEPPSVKQGMKLFKRQIIPTSHDNALVNDDCDDDGYVDFMAQTQPAGETPIALARAQVESLNNSLPTKREPVAGFNDSRVQSAGTQDALLLAAYPAYQKPAKASPPAKPSSGTAAETPQHAAKVTSAAAADAPKPTPTWDIVPTDKTLNAAIGRWAAMAGWQLLWELPIDYAVEARTTVPGTFEEAVTTVTTSMETAEIPMKAIFYNGNRVLRIVAKGVE